MKKIHIIAVAMIVIAALLFMNVSDEMGQYATFNDATELEKAVKVVGQLSKDKKMTYDPLKDPNYFSFFMKDADGQERKVIYYEAKPQDFEMSEQIVVTGMMQGEDFVASDMLLKCPSKYKDEEILLQSKG